MEENICAWQQDDNSSDDDALVGRMVSVTGAYLPQVLKKRNVRSRTNQFKQLTDAETQTGIVQKYSTTKPSEIKRYDLNCSLIQPEIRNQYISLPVRVDRAIRSKPLKNNNSDFYVKQLSSIVPQLDNTSSQIFSSSKHSNKQTNILRIKKQYLQLRLQNVTFSSDERYNQRKFCIELNTKADQPRQTFRNDRRLKMALDPFAYQPRSKIDEKLPTIAQMSTQINKKLQSTLTRKFMA